MDCNELLRLQLSKRLICQSQQIAIGPTGPAGTSAPTTGIQKAFTIFIDYSAISAISRVYIPPGMFSSRAFPGLASGGVFTSDQATDLIFLGTSSITLANTTYAFCTGILVSGYVPTNGGEWNPAPGGNINNTHIYYSQAADYSNVLKGLSLVSINGASLTPKPLTGVAAGFLATVTLFYV
jgi:hypothetical protein